MRNALFWKEWREQAKVAVLGLLVFSLLIVKHYVGYSRNLEHVAGNEAQPLLSPALLMNAGYFCAIFGLVLGWLQIRAEKHLDLWAFLVHRPMSRTNILAAKIAAGLCLYAAGAGLPMLAFVVFALIPGHIAAPFAWGMTLPLLAIFLGGIVCYFAGMLTAVRQARWYGSRGFGLALALITMVGVFNVPEFWQALLFVWVDGGILAVALWGSFQSGGYYRHQPLMGKLALIAACVTATTILVCVGTAFVIESLELNPFQDYNASAYMMTTNGVVYKFTNHSRRKPDIADLDGRPLLDPKTGQRMTGNEFNRRIGPHWELYSFAAQRKRRGDHYMGNQRFFLPWRYADKTLWYVTRDGAVIACDTVTRRRSGSLEAPGIAAGVRLSMASDSPLDNFKSESKGFLASATTLYRVNLEDRSLKPIFSVTNDTILRFREALVEADEQITFQALIVATEHSIDFLHPDGSLRWTLPYEPSYLTHPRITIYALQPENRFTIEFAPDIVLDGTSATNLPYRFKWLAEGAGVTQSVDLPPFPRFFLQHDLTDKAISALVPPVATAIMRFTDAVPFLWNPLCIVFAVLSAIVGWWLGRRYSFSPAAQMSWAAFHLLFGLPGLLAFLSVQEWPARESCPHCKKLRVVDREKCPHCEALFPTPEKSGTEIFESLAAS